MNELFQVYCRSCRKPIGPEHKFCPLCGAPQTREARLETESPRPADTPPPRQSANREPTVPDSFAVLDYRYVACPDCRKPVRRSSRGNPPQVTCPACDCTFMLDRNGGIPVVCPACQSTDAAGGGFCYLWLLLGPVGFMLASVQPTKYRCRSCDCHFIGAPGADAIFGFFIN